VLALRAHREWQERNVVAGLKRDLVFPSNTGGYRNPAVLRKPLMRCCKVAGVSKHLSSHCLRKTANNLLRMANSDVVVRAMIGHATSEMTRLYSNVDHQEKAKAHAAAFGDVFKHVLPAASAVDGVVAQDVSSSSASSVTGGAVAGGAASASQGAGGTSGGAKLAPPEIDVDLVS